MSALTLDGICQSFRFFYLLKDYEKAQNIPKNISIYLKVIWPLGYNCYNFSINIDWSGFKWVGGLL